MVNLTIYQSVTVICAMLMQAVAKPSPIIKCKPLTEEQIRQEEKSLEPGLHWTFWLVPPLKASVKRDMPEFSKTLVTTRYTYLYGKEGKRCPPPKKRVSYEDDDSECPVHYVMQHDRNRIPENIVHARCSCKHCRYMNNLLSTRNTGCEPIVAYTRVRRRTSKCDYVTVYEEVPIGCKCASRAKHLLALDLKPTSKTYPRMPV